MSHRDAPAQTANQLAFEKWYGERWKQENHAVAFGRDQRGSYFATATRIAWELWQHSKTHNIED